MKRQLMILFGSLVLAIGVVTFVACGCNSDAEDTTSSSPADESTSGYDLPEDTFDVQTTVVEETTIVNETDPSGKVTGTKVEKVKKTYIVDNGTTAPYEETTATVPSSKTNPTTKGDTPTTTQGGGISPSGTGTPTREVIELPAVPFG